MIGSRLATVLIFAIIAFTVTAISVTAMVLGYLEKKASSTTRGGPKGSLNRARAPKGSSPGHRAAPAERQPGDG